MENYEALRTEIDRHLEQVEANLTQLRSQVALSEAEKVDLKRRRNSLAPVARLPPELTVKIFSFYLSPLSSSELEAFCYYQHSNFIPADKLEEVCSSQAVYQQLLRPGILTLSHVSHGWKEMAISSKDLWSAIQVQLRTSPELVDLMWRNAGGVAISMDLTGIQSDRLAPNPHDFPVYKLIQGLLRNSIGRFKAIGIYCHTSTLLDVMHGRADDLVSFTVTTHPDEHPTSRRHHNQLLAGGAPNLQRIHLHAVTIPMSITLFSSPHFTYVHLVDTHKPTPESMAGLVSFLRPLKLLTKLYLELDSPAAGGNVDFFLSLTRNRTPIELPNLKHLNLHTVDGGTLGAVMSLLHVPKSLDSLDITTGSRDRDDAEAILNFVDQTMGQDAAADIAPEEIELEHWATCRKESQFRWQSKEFGGASRKILTVEKSPKWMNFKTSDGLTSTAFRVPWSFHCLRCIGVLLSEVPHDFWTSLAALDTLEIVRVDSRGAAQSLFKALSNESSHDSSTTPIPYSATALQSRRDIPFPALQAIFFESFHGATTAVPVPFGQDVTTVFIKEIVVALQSRGGPTPLLEVRFLDCKDRFPKKESAKLGHLFHVAECAIRDQDIYFRNPMPMRSGANRVP